MQETWIWSRGQEDHLEKGMAIHSSILAWRIPWTEEPVGYSPWSQKESDMTKWLTHKRAAGKLRRKTTALIFKKEMDNGSYKPEHDFSFQNILRQMTLVSQWTIML